MGIITGMSIMTMGMIIMGIVIEPPSLRGGAADEANQTTPPPVSTALWIASSLRSSQ
jgi:hypothetical protein